MKIFKFVALLAGSFALAACVGGEVEQEGVIEEAVEVASEAVSACAEMPAPVHHRVKPNGGASLYTLNANEAANAATNHGFTDDRGIAFYGAASTGTGLSPVYRLYNPTLGNFLWTIDENERDKAKTQYGYTSDEGIRFYASKTSRPCLIPVYRYRSPTLNKHRFATSAADRASLSASGWLDEGVKFYAAPEATVTPPDDDTKFTFVVIPDTQQEIVYAPTRFTHRLDWIVANRASLDVRFVAHSGDMVDWDTPDHIHYVRASDALVKLDTAQIPYAIAIGNHDTAAVCQGGSACPGNVNANLRNTTTFNTYFPTSRFSALSGVYEAGKIDNSYHRFTAGGSSWMVLSLELWARTGAVDWAKTVLAQHPNDNVIVITHSHLNSNGTIMQTNGGYGNNSPQYVFDNLIKQYANVRLVFSGHVGNAAYRLDTGVHGNQIHQFLNCFHDGSTNPTRLVEIDTAANTLSTRVYAPATNTERSDGKHTLSNMNWL
ncbi:metallophosphoesterase [Chondromyces crocatus]|uniref:Metallophosphoesterase n=1 Tax=Chondromyces crocatus TaxID=52 RepID=A0A0K1EKU6_CHOCO|nr:metallophosphoesterase [Chondromyces crocatus]AKT41500.1 metallophosphoesterase [Chondromyces crocatus]